MGTRCGSIDPSIVTYMMKKTGMTPDEMDTALNKKSGLLGVSGVSNDARRSGQPLRQAMPAPRWRWTSCAREPRSSSALMWRR